MGETKAGENFRRAVEEIAGAVLSGEIKEREELNRYKIIVSRKYHLSKIPGNSDILKAIPAEERDRFRELLKKKPTRTISGVAVVAMMTKPFPCPHGRCIYCPGGPSVGSPQSYTGKEPSALRAVQSAYHPYIIMMRRLKQLTDIGHDVDKVEVIIQGGTFPAVDLDYQEWFVKEAFKAMNDFPYFKDIDDLEDKLVRLIVKRDKSVFEEDPEFKRAWEKTHSKPYYYLENEQRKNEKAKVRMVGLTIETRPDWAFERQIDRMLKLGTTRVELGVQTVFNFIHERTKRGHGVEEIIKATRLLRDAGLKINYHIMPGLPGSSFERDLYTFQAIFEDSRYRPDMLKIYPTLVTADAPLYAWYKAGKYRPYTTEEAVELLVEAYKLFPKWVRVMRIQRDIPAKLIVAGVKHSNLGQLVFNELVKRGIRPREIRFREVGHMMEKFGIQPEIEHIELLREDYDAAGGKEIFLSFEDTKNDILIGFIRLRIPSEKAHRKEINCCPSAIVRELHVYGPLVPIGGKPKYEWQHRGYGRELLAEAERIAREEFDVKKMLVISGVGVRNYYRKFGYRKNGPYVAKRLDRGYADYEPDGKFDAHLNT
ncbi:tRNA uridine(34) 5-carboxymethylaminomethyl modification radical SAM/GNAT enzyme Elp3 [Thermococcus sp. Bubb.Bath]|uniref:tRNA uridine(34) 5-carboxymethylaminomethyl modification radical SAM/GNAT enzyme Elp3 n=1 Tax=Thermococcus sp. Bubb.Bath TaxID=1638242 RepID=UPI00143BCACB|nr:tRNA uridine(34) 5-carboxymethylaminomethyl modification radical SAM/GNAT enzyme Elp3 [Thermococcus sp. Bubb.Bath]NJF25737.1 tRNA uridine(34) 5-carboxymethylaminomethyl modification radical SAM/GNAT enzyme Elp3 [Thermococcus sp. Bubb.Bath]